MKAILRQSGIGRYNLCSNENSLVFTMFLKDKGDIAKYDGEEAILHITKSGEDLEQLKDELNDYFDRGYFDNIFEYAWDYASRVISSSNYKKQCLAFAMLYAKYAEEINSNLLSNRKQVIEQKIEKLQKQLDEMKEIPNVLSEMETIILKDADKYLRWAESEKKDLNDLRPESEKYKEKEKKFEEYLNKSNEVKIFVEQLQKT